MNAKNMSEFSRALRNKRYELADDGRIFMPEQKAYLGGTMMTSRNHGGWESDNNLVVAQGRDYLLNAGLNGGTVYGAFFVIPFATNTVVIDTLTAANFNSAMTEFTNYSETTRKAWASAGSTGGVITNAASPATITIAGGAQTAVYGAALGSVATIGASTGIIFCAALATRAKTGLESGETLSFKYGITATSS